jgi:hypothetical protein
MVTSDDIKNLRDAAAQLVDETLGMTIYGIADDLENELVGAQIESDIETEPAVMEALRELRNAARTYIYEFGHLAATDEAGPYPEHQALRRAIKVADGFLDGFDSTDTLISDDAITQALDALRLAHIYMLLHIAPGEIADDFDSSKWEGYEREAALQANAAYRILLEETSLANGIDVSRLQRTNAIVPFTVLEKAAWLARCVSKGHVYEDEGKRWEGLFADAARGKTVAWPR